MSTKRIVLTKTKDCKGCCRYEAKGMEKARGNDHPIISTLYLNRTFGEPMPEIIEVAITPGVASPAKR